MMRLTLKRFLPSTRARSRRAFAASLLALALLLGLSGQGYTAEIVDIPIVPYYYNDGHLLLENWPVRVSADGRVVVGTEATSQVFKWTEDGGFSRPAPPLGAVSCVTGVNEDGTIMVGRISGSPLSSGIDNNSWMSVWNELVRRAPPTRYVARGVSGDGRVVVGYAPGATGVSSRGFLWTEAGGLQYLPFPYALAVSADGRVVVGDTFANTIVRWTASGGAVDIGRLSGTVFTQSAGISGDGNTIIGHAGAGGTTSPVRWTPTTGWVNLGNLPGQRIGIAQAASYDGSVIVGSSGVKAFRWSEATGMQSLWDYLVAKRANLASWSSLLTASGISADGKTIVGTGYLTSGTYQVYIARDGAMTTQDSLDNSLQRMRSIGPTVSTIGEQGLTQMMIRAHSASAGALIGRSSGDEMVGETRMWVVGTLISNYEMNGRDAGGQGGVGITRDFGNGYKLGGGIFSGARTLDTENGGNQRTFVVGPGAFLAYAPARTGLRTEIGGMIQYTELDLKRGYVNGGGTSTSMGNTDAMIYGLSGRAGYAVAVTDKFTVEPFGQYLWNQINIHGYTEKNGPFPATFDKQTEYINKTRAGMEFSYALTPSVELTASGAWVHRFEDRSAAMSGTLTGISAFSYNGNIVDKDWGEASVGAKWTMDSGAEAFVRVGNSYEKKDSGESDLNATAGLSWPM